MQEMVDEVRARGADASSAQPQRLRRRPQAGQPRPGIDVILTGHTHDACPSRCWSARRSSSPRDRNGKFVSRIDLDVRDGRMMGYRTS
jgi:sulfur-oxidizing protein SoxB